MTCWRVSGGGSWGSDRLLPELSAEIPEVNGVQRILVERAIFRPGGRTRSQQPSGYHPRKQRENSASRTRGEWVAAGGWRSNGNSGRTVSGAFKESTRFGPAPDPTDKGVMAEPLTQAICQVPS